MPINDDLSDALVRHQIGLQRLGNAEVRKLLALLKRVEVRVSERLLSADLTQFSRKRAKVLLQDIRKITRSVYTDATGKLQIEVERLALYELDYQQDLFKRMVPIELDVIRPANDQIIAAVNSRPFQGRIMREWLQDLEETAFARLRGTIRQGFVEGRTTPQIIQAIRGTAAMGYRDGIAQINRNHAATVTRTAIAHTANTARSGLYRRNPNLIAGVQWVSTLDTRTSAICRARDGAVGPVDASNKDWRLPRGAKRLVPPDARPPAHPNCRSTTTPILKSWQAMGLRNLPGSTRASMDGQVSADLTYNDWLRKQTVATQNEVLGVRAGRLYRQGGLSVDRFVNDQGRAYTLDELRVREAEAWDRAFAG